MQTILNHKGRLMQRLKFLELYKPVIVKKLLRLKDQRGALTELATQIHVDPARLSEIMGDRRNLTSEYIIKMVGGGFVTVAELIAGRGSTEMGPEEADFIDSLRIVEDREWVKVISELKKDKRKEETAKRILNELLKN